MIDHHCIDLDLLRCKQAQRIVGGNDDKVSFLSKWGHIANVIYIGMWQV